MSLLQTMADDRQYFYTPSLEDEDIWGEGVPTTSSSSSTYVPGQHGDYVLSPSGSSRQVLASSYDPYVNSGPSTPYYYSGQGGYLSTSHDGYGSTSAASSSGPAYDYSSTAHVPQTLSPSLQPVYAYSDTAFSSAPEYISSSHESPYSQQQSSQESSATQHSSGTNSTGVSATASSHRCDFPGCSTTATFKRRGDLERHKKTVHATDNIKPYDCLANRCVRKGANGFTRIDHRNGHMKQFHSFNPEQIRALLERERHFGSQ